MRLRHLASPSLVLLLTVSSACGEIVEAETKGTAGLESASSSSSSSTDPTGVETSTSASSTVTASGGSNSGTDASTSSAATTDDPSTTTDPGTSTDPGTASDTSTTTGTSDTTTTGPNTTGPECVDAECELGVCVGGECGDAPSCLALQDAHPDLGDGLYTLDPDGPGGNAPIEVSCDMLEGGWSCVYFNDFEGGAEGWSKTAITTCGNQKILGGHDKLGKNNPVNRAFDLLGIAHTELRLNAVLYAIDTWDNEAFRVELDGEALYTKKCDASNGGTCNHNGNLCGWSLKDGVLPFTATAAHVAENALLHFAADLDESMKNESFGLDDVRVCIK